MACSFCCLLDIYFDISTTYSTPGVDRACRKAPLVRILMLRWPAQLLSWNVGKWADAGASGGRDGAMMVWDFRAGERRVRDLHDSWAVAPVTSVQVSHTQYQSSSSCTGLFSHSACACWQLDSAGPRYDDHLSFLCRWPCDDETNDQQGAGWIQSAKPLTARPQLLLGCLMATHDVH